jgi:hypothetical protein
MPPRQHQFFDWWFVPMGMWAKAQPVKFESVTEPSSYILVTLPFPTPS